MSGEGPGEPTPVWRLGFLFRLLITALLLLFLASSLYGGAIPFIRYTLATALVIVVILCLFLICLEIVRSVDLAIRERHSDGFGEPSVQLALSCEAARLTYIFSSIVAGAVLLLCTLCVLGAVFGFSSSENSLEMVSTIVEGFLVGTALFWNRQCYHRMIKASAALRDQAEKLSVTPNDETRTHIPKLAGTKIYPKAVPQRPNLERDRQRNGKRCGKREPH